MEKSKKIAKHGHTQGEKKRLTVKTSSPAPVPLRAAAAVRRTGLLADVVGGEMLVVDALARNHSKGLETTYVALLVIVDAYGHVVFRAMRGSHLGQCAARTAAQPAVAALPP